MQIYFSNRIPDNSELQIKLTVDLICKTFSCQPTNFIDSLRQLVHLNFEFRKKRQALLRCRTFLIKSNEGKEEIAKLKHKSSLSLIMNNVQEILSEHPTKVNLIADMKPKWMHDAFH